MTDKSQLDKFKALAKEAECDTDEKKFDRSLKAIAKSPPPKPSDQEDDKPAE